MNTGRASRDPGRYAVDYGHRIEPVPCVDEAALCERRVLTGLRRAETERSEAFAELRNQDEEALPSEIFFG